MSLILSREKLKLKEFKTKVNYYFFKQKKACPLIENGLKYRNCDAAKMSNIFGSTFELPMSNASPTQSIHVS